MKVFTVLTIALLSLAFQADTFSQTAKPIARGSLPNAAPSQNRPSPQECRYTREAARWINLYESESSLEPASLESYSKVLNAQLRDFGIRLGRTRTFVNDLASEGVIQMIDAIPPEQCPTLPRKPSVYVANMKKVQEGASLNEVMRRLDELRIAQGKDALLSAPHPFLTKENIDALAAQGVTTAFQQMIRRDALLLILNEGRENVPKTVTDKIDGMSVKDMESMLQQYISQTLAKAKAGTFLGAVKVP